MQRAALLAILASLATVAEAAVDPGTATAPQMEFTPPAPGSYTLEKIQRIKEATLLDTGARATALSAFTTGKITLLTFFYTYCADPLGCPFAYHTLKDIRAQLLADPALAQQVRFVGISFDPTHDTPQELASYREAIMGGVSFDWQVLTARSVRELLPVLEDFGQDVSVERAADGTARRTLHHMLKVFLIDDEGSVREVYSLAYLQPAVILNDIRTLALEHR